MWRWFHQWGSPKFFHHRSGALIPVLALASGLILGVGVFWGLLIAPADYQQGESVRIMYVHVPAAILAQSSYAMMAVMALISLIWRLKIADAAVQTVAPIGACITLLALATGSLWGKPMWGTYWAWDPRLTSFMILLVFYFGYLALWEAIEDKDTAADLTSILCIVGSVFALLSRYAVNFWSQGLHQGASLSLDKEQHVDNTFYFPLLICIAGMVLLFVTLVLIRTRTEIRSRRLLALRLRNN